LKIYFT